MKTNLCLSLLMTLVLFGCGGGDSDSDLSGTYSVNDVNILSDDIDLGESARTEVFFETKTEIDGSPNGVEVVVRIPAELDYVIGTSELYDGSTNDADRYTPNNIINCSSGETFLVYDFRDFELFGHELGLSGRFGIKFQVQGRSPTSLTLVGATAGDVVSFNCGEFFAAEQNEGVLVKAP